MNSEIQQAKRILIRGVNWIGDAVMSMPSVSALRSAFSDSTISLLTNEKLIDIWMKNPDLNEIIPLEENLCSVAKKIRHHKFDLAIAFPNSHRSAIELWLGGVKERVGYKGFLRSLFLTRTVNQPHKFVKIKKLTPRLVKSIIEGKSKHPYTLDSNFHHIYNYLALVTAVGAKQNLTEPKIEISWNELMEVKTKFNFKTKYLIAINPGAEYGSAKRWLKERFAQAAVELWKKIECGVCVTGGKGDMLICLEIARTINEKLGRTAAINLAGQTTLRELCAVFKLCNVVISNDTGPMHLAAASGSRVVAIFGSTSPELTGPGLPGSTKHAIIKSTQPCSPCFLRNCPIDFRCMRSITVEQVVNAAMRLLSEQNKS